MLAKGIVVAIVLITFTAGLPDAMAQSSALWTRGMSLEEARDFSAHSSAIAPSRFHVVDAAQERRAETALSSVPIVQISPSDAAKFLVTIELEKSATKFFLVRGCTYNEATGAFNISVSGQKLVVSNVSLGAAPGETKKRALVVVLDTQPSDVFVGCGLAR